MHHPQQTGTQTKDVAPSFLRRKVVSKTTMQDDGCLKFISLFIARQDGPFDYDKQHIDRVEFRPLIEINQMIADKERMFTPTFLHVLESFYRAARIR